MLITMNREIMFRQLTDLNLKWIKLIKMMPSLHDVSTYKDWNPGISQVRICTYLREFLTAFD